MKLESYTLAYSLLISLILFILVLSFYQYKISSNSYLKRLIIKNEVELNLQKGLELLSQPLYNSDHSDDHTWKPNGLLDKAGIRSFQWGLHSIGIAYCIIGEDTFHKAAIYGVRDTSILNTALFIRDDHKSVSDCGGNIINGDLRIPKRGILKTRILGLPKSANSVYEGRIRYSSDSLLPLKIPKLSNPNIGEGIHYETSISNDFESKPLRINYENIKDSKELKLTGQILLHSKSKIILKSNWQLEDIIVEAPKVIIENGFEGSLQIFASEMIHIEQNCNLTYPSILVLKDSFQNALIQIDSTTKFNGCIISYNKNSIIQFASNSITEGILYSYGEVEAKGNIWSSIFCDHISLTGPSGTKYINYLKDLKIDLTKRSRYFIHPNFFDFSGRLKILKYL